MQRKQGISLNIKNVAATVFMGTLWGVFLFAMLAKSKSLSVSLVVVKNMKGYKMKKNEITCDLCGATVAEKDDCLFSKFETRIPYIKVPYNYIGEDYTFGVALPFNARSDFYICKKCLKDLKADLSFNRKMEREREVEE